jgi:hypothetical protein
MENGNQRGRVMTVYKWSQTAASNATIDDTINAREGQAPSTVNDAMRGIMAAVAKWRADMSGNLVTAGSSTAYTLTTNQVYNALTDGIAVAARMDEVNGAAATLNVDGLGAKAIATVYGTAVGAGKLRAGAVYVFVYDSTDDKWIVQGDPNAGFESGTKVLFQQTTAPVGWTKDTTHDNKALRVVSGTASSGGTTAFSSVFAARTIATANLPSHTHDVIGNTGTEGAHTHLSVTFATSSTDGLSSTNYTAYRVNLGTDQDYTLFSTTTAANAGLTTAAPAHAHAVSIVSSATGSGTAMDFAVQYVDVTICTRN